MSLTAHGANNTNDAAIAGEEIMSDHLSRYLTDLTNNNILPGYQSFATSSQKFNQAAVQFCALPTPHASDLIAVQKSWLQTSLSWQSIQWLKVGPIVDVAFRIQYWPDGNKAVTRAISRHLLGPDTISAQSIANKNVGGQGLPAAERLLFPPSNQDSLLTGDNKAKRCELLTAISKNLNNIAVTLNEQWQPSHGNYAKTLITGTGEFNGVKDAVEELISNWLEQIDKVSDAKTFQTLGKVIPGLPQDAENHLSDSSLANIKININTFKQLYSAGNGHGFSIILSDYLGQKSLDQEMKLRLSNSLTAVNQLQGSYTQILADAEQRQQLSEVIENLRQLRNLFSTEFIKVAGLDTGFNSNDGD